MNAPHIHLEKNGVVSRERGIVCISYSLFAMVI